MLSGLPNFRRRLHLVFFVDTAKTHSFSISLGGFLASGFMGCALLGAITGFGILGLRYKNELISQRSYARALKHEIVEHELSQTASLAPDQQNIDATQLNTKGVIKESTLAPAAKSTGKSLRVDAAKAEAAPLPAPTPQTANVKFESFELAAQPDNEQGAILRFSLVNATAGSTSLVGTVCAMAQTEEGPSPFPEELTLSKADTPSNCEKGLPVKFSRLRPTEVSFSVAPSDILSVRIFFLDAETKTLFSKQIAKQNLKTTK